MHAKKKATSKRGDTRIIYETMLSYYGKVVDRWVHTEDDQHEHYRFLSGITFTLSRASTLSSLQLCFNLHSVWECTALKQFLEGESDRVRIDGSEGHIIIKSAPNQREFIFELGYQGPYVDLTFTLDHDVCHDAFRALASDLEKYPWR